MAGLDSYVKLYSNFNSSIQDDYGGKSLTANGDAQLDTAQKKFGTASLLLDGSADYLTVDSSGSDTDFDLGSGDFTIDCQVRFNVLPSGYSCLYSQRTGSGSNTSLGLYIRNDSGTYKIYCEYSFDGSTIKTIDVAIDSLSADTWYHVAICREGDVIGVFLDGVHLGSSYVSNLAIHNSSADVKIGATETGSNALNGWIDEFRFSKGIARYTLKYFEPPTEEVTADSNDVILLHMDGTDESTTFTDSSTYGRTVTANGNAKIKTGIDIQENQIPDMTSNTTPENEVSASSQLGSYAPWRAVDRETASFWASNVNPSWWRYDFDISKTIVKYTIQARGTYNAQAPRNWTFEGYNGSGWDVLDTQGSITFSSGEKKTFSFSNSTAYTDYRLNITDNSASGGDANYTTFVEVEMFEAVSETIEPVIGTGMGYLDGSGDYLTMADSDDFDFSNDDFTLSTYIYLNDTPTTYVHVYDQRNSLFSTYAMIIEYYQASKQISIIYDTVSSGRKTFSCDAEFYASNWFHLTIQRKLGIVYIYMNGSLINKSDLGSVTNVNSTGLPQIGSADGSSDLEACFDEYRLAIGIARYATSLSFTPPTEEYSSGDVTAPSITSLNPESGDNEVLVSQNLSITYDENVTAVSSKYINIYDYWGNLFESIEATNAKVTIVSNVVTINPTDDFAYGTIYYILIDAGAFESASSNGTAAVTDPAYWNFKTQSYDFNNTIIEINGEDYTDKAHMQSIKIITQDNFSNSASLKIVDNSNFIKMGMELIIRDTVTSEILFGGLILEPKKTLLNPEFMVLDIKAEGYKQIFGRRTFVVDAQNTTAGAIVDQTFTDFIKVGSSTSEELTEGNIATGATIENYVKPAETAMKIYNDLADSSGFKWWITNEKAFYFQAEPTYVDNTSTKVLTPDKTDPGYINCVDMPVFKEDSSKFITRKFVVGKKLENGSVVGSYTDSTKETEMAAIYGSGVFGSVITNRNINNTTDANDLAETEVKTYVNPAKIQFKTYDKINVLELISVDIDLLGISSETYKVTKVTKKIEASLKILSTIECEKYVAATKQKRVWTDEFNEMLKSNNEKDEQKEVLYDEWTAGGTILVAGSDVRTITKVVDTDIPLHTHYTIVGTCAGAGTVTVVIAIDATTKKTYTFDVVAGNFSKTLDYPIQNITTSGSSTVTATTTTTVNLVIAPTDLTFWVNT